MKWVMTSAGGVNLELATNVIVVPPSADKSKPGSRNYYTVAAVFPGDRYPHTTLETFAFVEEGDESWLAARTAAHDALERLVEELGRLDRVPELGTVSGLHDPTEHGYPT